MILFYQVYYESWLYKRVYISKENYQILMEWSTNKRLLLSMNLRCNWGRQGWLVQIVITSLNETITVRKWRPSFTFTPS